MVIGEDTGLAIIMAGIVFVEIVKLSSITLQSEKKIEKYIL